MGYMFQNCQALKSINLGQFNTASVTNMSYMFSGCSNLGSVDLSKFNTAKVTNMGYMFQNCQSLKSINLSVFNTASVTNMSYMFNGCSNLESIDLSKFNMSQVTSSSYMLGSCKSLKSVTISSTIDKAGSYAFLGVGSTSDPCTIVAPSGFDFGKDITGLYFNWKSGYFFLKDNKVSYALLDGTKLSFFHDASPWTRSGTKYPLNTGTGTPGWNGSKASITEVSFDASFANAAPTTTYKWFEGMTNLVSLSGMNYLDMSNVINDGYMFYGCSKLTSIPIPASAKSIDSYMFEGCSSLTSVDIPNGVTSIGSRAFYGCSNMTNTNIPVSVTRIDANAFNGCDNQVEVKVGFSSPMSILSTVFTNRKNAILIVPAGCKNAFASAAYWKEFKGIFEDKGYAIGDVNHDDDVNVTDASILVDFILGNKQEFFFIESADYDKNGIINVSDVTNLVDIILSK